MGDAEAAYFVDPGPSESVTRRRNINFEQRSISVL